MLHLWQLREEGGGCQVETHFKGFSRVTEVDQKRLLLPVEPSDYQRSGCPCLGTCRAAAAKEVRQRTNPLCAQTFQNKLLFHTKLLLCQEHYSSLGSSVSLGERSPFGSFTMTWKPVLMHRRTRLVPRVMP